MIAAVLLVKIAVVTCCGLGMLDGLQVLWLKVPLGGWLSCVLVVVVVVVGSWLAVVTVGVAVPVVIAVPAQH